MPIMLTQTQRGPASAKVTCTFFGEVTGTPAQVPKVQESEVLNIDDLVAVKTKVQHLVKKTYVIYIAYMKIHREENVKITLKYDNENENSIIATQYLETEEWSLWRPLDRIGLIHVDDYKINDKTYFYDLLINVSFRKIERIDRPQLWRKMYGDADFTDFSLSVVNGSVAVHKIIIASHSDVFKAMLNGEWKGATEGHIEVKGATQECLENLRDYMYLDILPNKGLLPLLLIASRYMMENLKRRCICELADTVTSENFHELLVVSYLNNIPELNYELLRSTPSQIVDDAYKPKNANKTCTLPESAGAITESK